MKQIHFRIPDDVYEIFERELEQTGLPSVTAQIKAAVISLAKLQKKYRDQEELEN